MSCLIGPQYFSTNEDFLSKFKTLRLLLEGVKVKKEDGNLIYCIITKLEPPYFVFVSTFHSTREAFISQGQVYKSPSFDAFCDSLIREQEKLFHIGLLNSENSSQIALAAQQKPNSRILRRSILRRMVLNQTRVLSKLILKMKDSLSLKFFV